MGSCVAFLVHGAILQQWIPMLKNCVSAEKKKIILAVKQSCQWLLKILQTTSEAQDGRVV